MKNKIKQILKTITAVVLILTLVITTETIVLAEEIKEQTQDAVSKYQEEKEKQDIKEAQQEYIEENQAAPAENGSDPVTDEEADSEQPEENESVLQQPEEDEVILSQPELESDIPDTCEQLYGEPVEIYEYGKVFRTDTNTYKFIGSSEPCLYEDDNGELKEIDNTLIEKQLPVKRSMTADAADTTYYTNAEGGNEITLPARMQEGRGLTIENKDGSRLELFPYEGTYENVSVLENAILYNEVSENIDVQYTIKGNSIKEDIIIREPGDKHTFSYRFAKAQYMPCWKITWYPFMPEIPTKPIRTYYFT